MQANARTIRGGAQGSAGWASHLRSVQVFVP
jgi:hypothetical protein